ncbi:MAG: acylphosphatase [Chlorobiales bacterium]|nr:acylphosphatase [Chlorobiales bacterium]
MAQTKRVTLIVHGLVQGVGYRVFIARIAKELNLCGWVRNLPDGTVEIEAQGPEQMLDELAIRAKKGPIHANVTSVLKDEKTPDINLDRFSVIMDVN